MVLLALDGASGEALGVATCFRGWSTFAARPLLNVHDLAVLPAHRRRGVARALLAAVEEAARREGAAKVTLEVRPDNAPAQALYRACGFTFQARAAACCVCVLTCVVRLGARTRARDPPCAQMHFGELRLDAAPPAAAPAG